MSWGRVISSCLASLAVGGCAVVAIGMSQAASKPAAAPRSTTAAAADPAPGRAHPGRPDTAPARRSPPARAVRLSPATTANVAAPAAPTRPAVVVRRAAPGRHDQRGRARGGQPAPPAGGRAQGRRHAEGEDRHPRRREAGPAGRARQCAAAALHHRQRHPRDHRGRALARQHHRPAAGLVQGVRRLARATAAR